MRPVTEEEYRAQVEPLLARLFRTTDPFDAPFTEELPRRVILLVDYWFFEGDEATALAKAIEAVGESGFFLTITNEEQLPDEQRDMPKHWFVPLADALSYGETVPWHADNAHYSTKGEWAILFSEERFALVAGSDLFADAFVEFFPWREPLRWETDERAPPVPVTEQVHSFLAFYDKIWWAHDPGFRWLRPLLTHMYGADECERLLREAGLSE